MGTLVVLDLTGGVVLGGLHMVRSGMLRAFGPDTGFLSTAVCNRFAASYCVTANVTQIDHISGFCMLNAFMGFDLLQN